MTEHRPAVDWEAVEREYRAGQLSVREIAKSAGVSHVAILKKAKAQGWAQNLAAKVREAVTTKLVTGEVTTPNINARQAVEEAAARVVQIVQGHRVRIARGQKIVERLFDDLDAEDDASIKDKSITLNNLSGALRTLISLERQAFGLSEGESGSQPEIVSKQQRDAAVQAALRADT